ncbi:MAG: RNA polymerase sigma factor [Desulfobacteraceae bacterium]|nr:RNA polymerase sigma factor [Desulfobacteraceae bacterium]MBC2752576.1 RNA polymerase sigma factor [Desulfobacteraceae bacterium]
MNVVSHHLDYTMAQETCTELLSGNNEAILVIYNKFHPLFLGYTRRRTHSLNDDTKALSILDDFWVELLNAKAICDFKGISSLKTYLFKILNYRIVDNVRRANRQGSYDNNVNSDNHDIDCFKDEKISPENDLMHKEKIHLINESLLMLTEKFPTDAHIVKSYLEGLNYQQTAEKMLSGKPFNSKELKKKTDAVKKQFTRPGTGSLAKFKSCLESIMKKRQLIQKDLLN